MRLGKTVQSQIQCLPTNSEVTLSTTTKYCMEFNGIRKEKMTKFSLPQYLLCQCEYNALHQRTAESKPVKNLIHAIPVYLAIAS